MDPYMETSTKACSMVTSLDPYSNHNCPPFWVEKGQREESHPPQVDPGGSPREKKKDGPRHVRRAVGQGSQCIVPRTDPTLLEVNMGAQT